jgi:hypothetical protein
LAFGFGHNFSRSWIWISIFHAVPDPGDKSLLIRIRNQPLVLLSLIYPPELEDIAVLPIFAEQVTLPPVLEDIPPFVLFCGSFRPYQIKSNQIKYIFLSGHVYR